MNDKYKNQNLPKANLSLIGAQGFWPNPLKAVRRVLRDKEREGVAKGRESATETFAPLIFCMRPCEIGFKGA